MLSSLLEIDCLLGDRGCDADWLREGFEDKAIPVFFPRSDAAQGSHDI